MEGIAGVRSFFFRSRKMILFFIWFLSIMVLLSIWICGESVNDRTVAISALVCGMSSCLFWKNREKIKSKWNSSWSTRKSFIIIGSLGAVWVETVFWFFETLLGATGVAASPNLLLDLLVTMPWYIMMVSLLFTAQTRYSYSYTEILLFGGIYELGADGIFGQVLEGMTGGGLLLVWYLIPLFVIVYSFIVLPPTYLMRNEIESIRNASMEKRTHRILSGLLPLLGLIPYFVIAWILTGFT
ncbi:MAG: hypothetical protein HXS53_12510 [Theionarchaea archaeon]|nr:hypothetical protein [Theionarchaea archaeon]